ncbi:tetratricopeptide repeat protein [Psychromicrobium lacuslunae]|uniref:Tetratrico peptide repeat group 5 domain-containing protein n=1 Tax=Psychromicrobium lacuslunae TaxID=1618207 RepID=A0A0D4C2D4_9MICC|nr:tetratricopeptide repeat protein [Psychromicrobium lacuslunae]AJT42545.1 hypothetical protein UM93_15550 [Psychromicrobium lacuslunae]
MTDSWEAKIDDFWANADDSDPDKVLRDIRALIAECPEQDGRAYFELASAHDFLANEAQAVALYREALQLGLDAEREPQAKIQLASTLRNLGQSGEAIEILEQLESDETTGSAAQAFLALALFDSGRKSTALKVALRALAPTLPLYRRSVLGYADELPAD